jgi:hypothetical protein
MLYRLAEGICLCKLDQINAEPKGNYNQLARRKTDQKSLRESECSNKTGSRGDEKCEDWKLT